MADLGFMKDFQKSLEKMDGVSTSSEPPRFWIDTGNCVLNYILSGDFRRGIPQGRVSALAGPSGSGKSFVQCNVTRQAQQDLDAAVVMIDTENALDDDFTSKIGIDTDRPDYHYISALTIDHAVKICSSFIKGYKKTYGEDPDAPKVLMVIDSLDMLLTDSELNNFEKGDNKGDQGQRAKQIKAFLRNMVQQIKNLNIAMVITHQVYAATQDMILKGASDGNWVINGAVKYSLSHLALLTKLKLKDGTDITGIKMKCQAVKTRFTKPFQDVVIEVPYEEGMNRYSGLVEVAEALGIIEKKGSYKKIVGTDTQFYAKDVADHADEIFEKIDELEDANIVMTDSLGLEEEVKADSQSDISKKRKQQDRMNQALMEQDDD